MPLRVKLFLVVILGVLAPMELASIYAMKKNRQELNQAFISQGRIMFNQIQLTRSWLSRHGGVYVKFMPFVKRNPYLPDADTATSEGIPITLRSPETVTRELSELSAEQGKSSFRLVSLKPINPDNLPDAWESEALKKFSRGAEETFTLIGKGGETRFRYIAPIYTEQSCHYCHQESGFEVGEVRGAISLEFPVGGMLVHAKAENRNLIIMVSLLGLLIVFLLWLGARKFALKPLYQVTGAVAAVGQRKYDVPIKITTNDELGDLARAVISMRNIVSDFDRRLTREVEVRTEELSRMKSRVQHERDFLINLFERMADGVCVVSGEGRRIEYINPSLEVRFGSAVGKKCHQVFFLRDHPCDQCPISPHESSGVQKRELTIPGSNKTFEMVETELEDPDGLKSWLMVFRDVTERKWLENELTEINRDLELKVREQTAALLEQERLAALGEISAGLAHEIRNPLSAILSGISLLESLKRTDLERMNIINLIKREARRLNSSLTDFLLFARPQTPKKVRIELNSLIREIAQLIEDDKEIKGEIKVILELEEMPPIWFDDDQLRQMIWNMVLNALQVMHRQGELTIRTRKGQDFWRLEIRDLGPGIPEKIQDQIFNPFFSTKKEGTGLGLSIVRRIIQAHGGSIEFQTEEGKGTTFIIAAPDNLSDVNA